MIRLFLNVCKTFHKIKHLHLNDYELYCYLADNSNGETVSCQFCKAPGHMFSKNGSYVRHLVFIDQGHVQDKRIITKNLKCTSCSKSHALLFSLIVPHSSYSIHFLVELIYSRLTRKFANVQRLCEFFDITERTFYRIRKRFLLDSFCINSLLNSFNDLIESLRSLFHSDSVSFHSVLQFFFSSCGYSFMQPNIILRQHVSMPSFISDSII